MSKQRKQKSRKTRGNIVVYFLCRAQIAISVLPYRDRRSIVDRFIAHDGTDVVGKFFVIESRSIGSEYRERLREIGEVVVDRRARRFLFFSPRRYPFSHQYCAPPSPSPHPANPRLITASSRAVQTPRIYILFPPWPLHHRTPLPLHIQPALPPVPPLPNHFTSVSECVNTCKDLKEKKSSLEFYGGKVKKMRKASSKMRSWRID